MGVFSRGDIGWLWSRWEGISLMSKATISTTATTCQAVTGENWQRRKGFALRHFLYFSIFNDNGKFWSEKPSETNIGIIVVTFCRRGKRPSLKAGNMHHCSQWSFTSKNDASISWEDDDGIVRWSLLRQMLQLRRDASFRSALSRFHDFHHDVCHHYSTALRIITMTAYT